MTITPTEIASLRALEKERWWLTDAELDRIVASLPRLLDALEGSGLRIEGLVRTVTNLQDDFHALQKIRNELSERMALAEARADRLVEALERIAAFDTFSEPFSVQVAREALAQEPAE